MRLGARVREIAGGANIAAVAAALVGAIGKKAMTAVGTTTNKKQLRLNVSVSTSLHEN